ncbi:transcription factor SPT20 homolog [Drosophila sulfurigaster albostrigata]|uniref:transcription factor SPT20 homolog n=1 Tax=Drosophila sulfurigaster albostrigata TaxID=89887 RepID=UPI002D21DA0E|nr:transcription factor SPT20 homolog [Drosophila sulfurigaster albostrigata]
MSTTTTTTSAEMPIDGQRFPLQRQQRAPLAYNPQQQSQQQHVKKHMMLVPGKFPFEQAVKANRFPMQQPQQQHRQQQLSNLSQCPTTLRFPLEVNHLSVGQRFPLMCQLPKKNLNYSIKITRDCGCRTPLAMAMSRTPKEFPTIKKQFVSFPNNQQTQSQPQPQQTCKSLANAKDVANAGHGNCQEKETRTDVDVDVCVLATPATMTQMSHNPNTKIDMDPTRTVETENDDDDVNVVSFDVHKATSDNELSAHEQTLNLNVVEAETAIAAPETKGVGERKEIEHQQAENFNDAFGRRHHNENDNDNNNNNDNSEKNNADDGNAGEGEGNADDNDDDAMNAISAKNKREICEQSKLETTAATHNELNMTKEQKSICLASEHARQIQTIAYTEQATTAASHNRPSDARGSSSEQVDGQQRQQEINVCQPVVKSNPPITIVTQNASQAASSSPSSGHPSIEFFECAVRELLEEGASSRVSLIDRDLFDLLSELVQLLATPTNTGLLWSEPLLEQVVSECVDMTVSKVSDDSETTTANVVDIYTEQIEQQPLELDDNQNNNSNNSNQTDMKYEALRSSSRLPESLSSSRLSSTAAAATVTPTATSRIRDTASTASSRIRDAASGITPATSRIRDVTTPVSSTATSRIRDATGPALSTTSSRIRDTTTPITAAATSRLRDTTPTATSATTSRIRDVPTATTTRPILSELKRNSTSRDDLSLDPDSVLPERTRLRRQRRMRSQDSVEEKPEDVVERINKLKARISASLSEVKNVIKQYSTESEAEAAGEKWLGPPTTSVTKVDTEPVVEQPVQFRFVKKVRRRSYFDEAEEEKEQAKEADKSDKETASQSEDNKLTKEKEVNEIKEEKQQDKSKSAGELSKSHDEQQHKEPAEVSTPIEQREKCNKDVSSEAAEPKISADKEKQKQTQETVEEKQKNFIEIKHSNKSEKEKQPIAKESIEAIVKGKQNEFIDVKEEKKPKVPTNAEEKKPQTTDCKQSIKVQEEQKQSTIITENQEQEQQPQKALVNGELPTEKSKEKDKVQSKIEFLAKVQSELKAKPKTKELSTIKEQPQETTAEAAATTETTPAITELKAAKTSEEVTATTPVVATSMSTTTSAAPTPIAAPAAAATSKHPVEGVEATPQSAALPKESATQPASIEDKKIAASKTETPANVVHKKKTTVKVKKSTTCIDCGRRAIKDCARGRAERCTDTKTTLRFGSDCQAQEEAEINEQRGKCDNFRQQQPNGRSSNSNIISKNATVAATAADNGDGNK